MVVWRDAERTSARDNCVAPNCASRPDLTTGEGSSRRPSLSLLMASVRSQDKIFVRPAAGVQDKILEKPAVRADVVVRPRIEESQLPDLPEPLTNDELMALARTREANEFRPISSP